LKLERQTENQKEKKKKKKKKSNAKPSQRVLATERSGDVAYIVNAAVCTRAAHSLNTRRRCKREKKKKKSKTTRMRSRSERWG
jgi:hypothetical protein